MSCQYSCRNILQWSFLLLLIFSLFAFIFCWNVFCLDRVVDRRIVGFLGHSLLGECGRGHRNIEPLTIVFLFCFSTYLIIGK